MLGSGCRSILVSWSQAASDVVRRLSGRLDLWAPVADGCEGEE